ncbi:MAG: type II toxin-antitoxin system VapC family toxin [Longimicrobiales bacterium]|nr:type II toxin-antitoxin system VapC family toxin [Longimicrobiales bacterium]
MTLVVDASVVVAALVDAGPIGEWAEEIVAAEHLVAPHLMPVEVADILRRAQRAGEITPDTAALAHVELGALPVDLFPYDPVASRAWALRKHVTMYDAGYLALAELLDADLATLDRRLTRAPGTACRFRLPPEAC